MPETTGVLDKPPVKVNTAEPRSLEEFAQQIAESDPEQHGKRGVFPLLRRRMFGIGMGVNKKALRQWFRSQVTKNDPQPQNK